jgi:hypothetical protein
MFCKQPRLFRFFTVYALHVPLISNFEHEDETSTTTTYVSLEVYHIGRSSDVLISRTRFFGGGTFEWIFSGLAKGFYGLLG